MEELKYSPKRGRAPVFSQGCHVQRKERRGEKSKWKKKKIKEIEKDKEKNINQREKKEEKKGKQRKGKQIII